MQLYDDYYAATDSEKQHELSAKQHFMYITETDNILTDNIRNLYRTERSTISEEVSHG